MARSTVKISLLVEQANRMLLNSPDESVKQREGICSLVESILYSTGNYNGYNYLTANHMRSSENGKSVGIIFDESEDRNHKYPDPTRRFYY